MSSVNVLKQTKDIRNLYSFVIELAIYWESSQSCKPLVCNEPQIKSTSDICCCFKNKLTFSFWPVVRLRLNANCVSHLKSGWIIRIQKGCLIEFNHFSINVYLIFWSSIRAFCLGSNPILHCQAEWASVRKVSLEGQKPELHSKVVLAPILVLC